MLSNSQKLLEAAAKGAISSKTLIELLESRADINAQNKKGETALIIATERGYTHVVDLLLKKDADLEVHGKHDDYTALMIAAYFGHSKIVKLLLEKKAAVNTTNKEGHTALMIAANCGHSETVKLLLEKKAAVNTENEKGHTALMIAVDHSYAKIVEMLLKAKANVNSQSLEGDSVLWFAADPSFLSDKARARGNHLPVINLLLAAKADPDIQNKEGETALTRAAEKGYKGIVDILLKKGAKTNVQTKLDGDTALTLAARHSHAPVVKMLLEAGANVDVVNQTGDTALYTAFNLSNTTEKRAEARAKRLPIIQLLLNADARPDILNKKGKTALMAEKYFFPKSTVCEEHLEKKQFTKDIYGLTDYQFRIWNTHGAKDLLFINNYYLYLPEVVCFIICLYLLPPDREEKVIKDELRNFVKNSPAIHLHRLETDRAAVRRNDPLLEKLLPPKDGFLANIKNVLTSSTKEVSPPKKNTNGELVKLLLEEFSQFTDDEDTLSRLGEMWKKLASPPFKLSGEEAKNLETICSSIIEDGRGNTFDKTRLKELYKTLSLILSGIQSQDNSKSCTQRKGASPGR